MCRLSLHDMVKGQHVLGRSNMLKQRVSRAMGSWRFCRWSRDAKPRSDYAMARFMCPKRSRISRYCHPKRCFIWEINSFEFFAGHERPKNLPDFGGERISKKVMTFSRVDAPITLIEC